MPIVDEEEVREMIADQRSEEFSELIRLLSKRPAPSFAETTDALEKIAKALEGLQKRSSPEAVAEAGKTLEEIRKSVSALAEQLRAGRPKSFTIGRNKLGLIEKITPEY